MNRCALCGRKINNREFNFGLGCLKKACTSLQIKNVKNLKGEYLLNNKIQRLCNCKKLPTLQSRMLTDRYLSLQDIQEDVGFKEEINSIIEENKNKKSFEISKVVTFANGDLMLALHDVTLQVKGEKQKENKWKLEIEILDLYDFTDLKELEEYVNGDDFFKGFVTSTANNLAMIATSCKIVSTYNIEIKFTIENWEV